MIAAFSHILNLSSFLQIYPEYLLRAKHRARIFKMRNTLEIMIFKKNLENQYENE